MRLSWLNWLNGARAAERERMSAEFGAKVEGNVDVETMDLTKKTKASLAGRRSPS